MIAGGGSLPAAASQGSAARPRPSARRVDEQAGGERIEYGYLLEAHTSGDIYVYFRDSNVLAVGDAVSPVRDPELDWFGGGWLGGRADSLARLLELGDARHEDRAKLWPGNRPCGRAEGARHDAQAVRARRRASCEGDGAEDISPRASLRTRAGRGKTRKSSARRRHKGMWAHHNTLMPDIV